jgi:hypothetical protein
VSGHARPMREGVRIDSLSAGDMSRCASILMGGLLAWMICLLGGCGAPAQELDLESRDPSFDHREVARYYHEQAARLWKVSEDITIRVVQYEHLFGPSSESCSTNTCSVLRRIGSRGRSCWRSPIEWRPGSVNVWRVSTNA